MIIWLVVEPTHLKNMLVKMGSSSPIFGVKIKKYLSCHHLDDHISPNHDFFEISWIPIENWNSSSNSKGKARPIWVPKNWQENCTTVDGSEILNNHLGWD